MCSAFVHLLLCITIVAPGLAQNVASSPYPPERVQCSNDLKIRSAHEGLCPNEHTWRKRRLRNVVQSLHSYLPRAGITGFDLQHYLDSINPSNVPIVGLAISGGGTQSGMGGLGLWQAFDERYPPAVESGVGGLIQCLTYLTGLSGGGFLTVSSLYVTTNSSAQSY